MTTNYIEKTYKHINENWKEDWFKACRHSWEEVQQFISMEPTNYQCKCGTYWINDNFISSRMGICAKCDYCEQPSLCNPINYEYVIKWIDPKWHKYILPENYQSS